MDRIQSHHIVSLFPIIKAHAEGKTIEFRNKKRNGSWCECPNPSWYPAFEYRIKPEPKVVVRYVNVYNPYALVGQHQYASLSAAKECAIGKPQAQLKLTYTDDILTKAEVIPNDDEASRT